MSFAGVVDEYDLFACLFRVMFGRHCLPIMFSKVHKAEINSSYYENATATVSETEVLNGFVAGADWDSTTRVSRFFGVVAAHIF